MEESSATKKPIAFLVLILLLGAGYLAYERYGRAQLGQASLETEAPSSSERVAEERMRVPTGFPSEIPVETGELLDVAATTSPEGGEQLSLSYRSEKSVEEKYREYWQYLEEAGYEVTAGVSHESVRSLFGVRSSETLSVAVSFSGGSTIVQIAYLGK